MSDKIRETEALLEAYFGRKRAFLVGRGATGLLLLYEALTPPTGRIVLPSIACPSLLATALLSGRKPVVVDVDSNLGMDPASAARVIGPGDLVVAVHLFGIPCAIDDLSRTCDERGAILVEDIAQAVGGRARKRALGTFGIASLVSFGRSKILPTIGGGAILTDDTQLAKKLEKTVKALPARPSDYEDRIKSMKQQANKVFNTARKDEPAAASEWKAIFDSFGGNIYRFSIEPEEIDAIQPAMDKLKEISTARRRRNGWYVLRFKDLEVEALKYPDECTPWRFSFVVPIFSGRRTQDLTKAFRDEKMNASNLYLPLQWLAPEAVEYTGCPRAEFAGLRIVNLWVDEKVDKSDVKKAADIFRRVYGSTDARTD